MKQTKLLYLRNFFLILLGSACFGLSYNLFLEPNGITCGGISGIALIIIEVFDLKHITIGTLSFLFNIPLFFFGYRQIGKHFFFGSLLGMAASSLFLDLFGAILPVVTTEPLLAAIFGGCLLGVGLGFVFTAGASTGGGDIVARLMKQKFRNFPIGKLLLGLDLVIAVATGIVYRQFNSTLFSIITLYLCSALLDKVVYGLEYAKVALIVSEKYEEISRAVSDKLDRGVTFLHGEGYYTRNEKQVLLSAVKRKQLAQLKELVMETDPSAFVILLDAHQVLGDGFKRYDRNDL